MECPICAGDMLAEVPVALKCGHVMHRKCCLMWFKSKPCECSKTCPICRQPSTYADLTTLLFTSAQQPTQQIQRDSTLARINTRLRKDIKAREEELAELRRGRSSQ